MMTFLSHFWKAETETPFLQRRLNETFPNGALPVSDSLWGVFFVTLTSCVLAPNIATNTFIISESICCYWRLWLWNLRCLSLLECNIQRIQMAHTCTCSLLSGEVHWQLGKVGVCVGLIWNWCKTDKWRWAGPGAMGQRWGVGGG